MIYGLVGASALIAVGPAALAGSATPLVTATGGTGALATVISVGGALAAGGVLLSLLAGVGRTALGHGPRPRTVLAARGDPPPLSGYPTAELTIGAVVLALVLLFDLRAVIGFSSFAVLVYYAVANSAALTLHHPERRRSSVNAAVGPPAASPSPLASPWAVS